MPRWMKNDYLMKNTVKCIGDRCWNVRLFGQTVAFFNALVVLMHAMLFNASQEREMLRPMTNDYPMKNALLVLMHHHEMSLWILLFAIVKSREI